MSDTILSGLCFAMAALNAAVVVNNPESGMAWLSTVITVYCFGAGIALAIRGKL